MNLCRWFLLQTAVLMLVLLALLVAARQRVVEAETRLLPARQALVRQLGLTDLALWSEAHYTRHPAMTDNFAAFQDFPSAPDHFPAGSLVAPLPLRPTTRIEIHHPSPNGR